MRSKAFSSSWLLALLPLSICSACQYIDAPPNHRQDSWWWCDNWGCMLCTPAGCQSYDDSCTGSSCTTQLCSTTSQCPTGRVCKGGTCVAFQPPCTDNSSCGDGAYCSNGSCINSGRCSTNSDCLKFGSNLVCDSRGSCVPAPQPESCTAASSCADGLCLDGSCGTCSGDCGGGTTCQFNNHCGEGRVCLDGQCTSSCSKPEDCGSAQTCKSSVCVPDTSGFCLKSTDCGAGKACLNNICYATCSGNCSSAKDVCSAAITVGDQQVRLCMPDHSAKPECELTKDCSGGMQCVNGVCRTVCVTNDDCAACPNGPVCGKGGFCMTAIENVPDCATNANCSNQSCLNGECITL